MVVQALGAEGSFPLRSKEKFPKMGSLASLQQVCKTSKGVPIFDRNPKLTLGDRRWTRDDSGGVDSSCNNARFTWIEAQKSHKIGCWGILAAVMKNGKMGPLLTETLDQS